MRVRRSDWDSRPLHSLILSLSLVACGGGTHGSTGSPSGGGGDASGGASATAGSSSSTGNSSNATSSTTSTSSGSGASVHKRGVAYGYHSTADMASLQPSIGWWYNWSPVPDKTLGGRVPAGVEFVPMIWGGSFQVSDLVAKIPEGSRYLLAFNEPNFGSQANLTPQQAADRWSDVEAVAKQRNLKIVSPAVNFCGGTCNETNPFDWLDKFFAACTNCQVDAVAVHWYACTKEALTWYLGQAETKYDKPVWLTEFSCLDDATITTDKESSYMSDALAVLEADPKVERYAWFSGRDDGQPAVNLLGSTSGDLTPLGQEYVSFAPNGP